MRKGVNPEKYNTEKNTLKQHRVIIPVHIPHLDDGYFKQSLEVLKVCLKSLDNTIESSITNVTIIADGCMPNVIEYLQSLAYLDKLIINSTNRGKVYSVMQEVKACYEDYVTIADADVLFFENWWQETASIFNRFEKAGAVSPVPAMIQGLNQTSSVFFDHFCFGGIHFNSIVSEKDSSLFFKGLNNPALLKRYSNNFNWDEKQYYLDKNSPVIIGATHFVATYKRKLLIENNDFPQHKFKKGYELEYLDIPIDTFGYYRLSTAKCYAYHMGNTLDETVSLVQPNDDVKSTAKFPTPKNVVRLSSYYFRKLIFKILNKFAL